MVLHLTTHAMKAPALCTAKVCRHCMVVLPPDHVILGGKSAIICRQNDYVAACAKAETRTAAHAEKIFIPRIAIIMLLCTISDMRILPSILSPCQRENQGKEVSPPENLALGNRSKGTPKPRIWQNVQLCRWQQIGSGDLGGKGQVGCSRLSCHTAFVMLSYLHRK